jgi:excisionase family DNA binding protein
MAGLMTTRAVAEHLAISERHVQELAQSGELQAVKLGRLWRFRPAAVEAFEQRHTTSAEPERQVPVVAAAPALTAMPDGGRVLGERWWENRQNDAASQAAQRGGPTTNRKAALVSS